MAEKTDISHLKDRNEMLKAFDETKTGVKGLADSGVSEVPPIFVRPSEELARDQLTNRKAEMCDEVPVIDLSGIRKQIVEQVRKASETWGFFQVVNHGIPRTVLDEMIDGVREFNEQDVEEKKKFYSRDNSRAIRFNSNYDLFTAKTASWRDTFAISSVDQICTDELPPSCRKSTVEYAKHVSLLGKTVLELLSEGLGLEPNHLNEMECSKEHRITCHYYPACPQPELTLGITKHSDIGFITILLQNQIKGLQVLYQDQWVDIQPLPGALVINIGDLLQLVSNGKLISSKHRVAANRMGPRISVASFFNGPYNEVKCYGPIEEVISQQNPPKYKQVLLGDYLRKFINTGLDNYLGLDYYKL